MLLHRKYESLYTVLIPEDNSVDCARLQAQMACIKKNWAVISSSLG